MISYITKLGCDIPLLNKLKYICMASIHSVCDNQIQKLNQTQNIEAKGTLWKSICRFICY